MANTIEQDVCKSVRALGFSAARTRRIVDGLRHDLRHCGPEWVANRVKGLSAYYSESGDFPGWVRKKTRSDGLLKPRGWMGDLVGSRTRKDTILIALSTVRGSIRMDHPTPKQLQKWSGAVTEPPTPGEVHFDELDLPGIKPLERRLVKKLNLLQPFGPDDIHGSRYPYGFESGTIARGKVKPDFAGMYHAWSRSLYSAPSASWVFQDASGVRIPGMPVRKSRPLLNAMRKGAPDSTKRKPSKKRKGRTLDKVQDYPIGHISFLQEPFGKLRTVANPNRFVQWQLTPLGEVLSDWINHQPGIYNLDQEGGIVKIQGLIAKGRHLTSADLSSASDTLDYVQVTRLLKGAGPEMRKHLDYFEQCSAMPWYVGDCPEAVDHLGSTVIRWKQGQPLGLRPSFPVLTICNWFAAREAVRQVRWRDWSSHAKLRNDPVAREEKLKELRLVDPDPPFAIVGDDIVIDSHFAKEYQKQISLLGGVANVDKAMASDVQAEFCSRLIDKDRVLRLKSRYLVDNMPQNVLTYQSSGLPVRIPHWVRRMAKRVGSFALFESGAIPNYHPDEPKPIEAKVIAHAVLSLDRGKTTKEEVSLLTMWFAGLENPAIGDVTSHRRRRRKKDTKPKPKAPVSHDRKAKESSVKEEIERLQDWTRDYKFETFKMLNPDWDIDELPIKLGMVKKTPGNCKIRDNLREQALDCLVADPRLRARFPGLKWESAAHPSFMDEVVEASARKQTVETQRSVYDHKTNARVPVINPDKALSRLDKKLERVSRDQVRDAEHPALIRQVSKNVDELLEVEDGKVFSTFATRNQTSERREVSSLEVSLPEPEVKDEPEFEL